MPVAPCQDLVYKTTYDWAIKLAIKSGKSAPDVLDTEIVRLQWEDVLRMSAAGTVHKVVSSPFAPESKVEADATGLSSNEQQDEAEDAKGLVTAGCQLVDGSENESCLTATLRRSAVSRVQGGKDGYVVIIYDVKASAEDATDPLRRAHVDRVTRVALKARSDAKNTMNPGDVYVLFDGGRHEMIGALQGCLRACSITTRTTMHIIYSEEGLLDRRKALSTVGGQSRNPRFTPLRQREDAHFVTATAFCSGSVASSTSPGHAAAMFFKQSESHAS